MEARMRGLSLQRRKWAVSYCARDRYGLANVREHGPILWGLDISHEAYKDKLECVRTAYHVRDAERRKQSRWRFDK